MTRVQLDSLTNISNQLINFNWSMTEYEIARRLNAAIPNIGRIAITSTYRTSGGAPRSYHLTGRAIDFVPREKPLWTVYLILRGLGFSRIGLRPDANMIHIDSGTGTYYFIEGTSGEDQGLLSSQPISRLAAIPGYSDAPAAVSSAAIAGSGTGVFSTKEKFIVGLAIAGLIVSKLLWYNRY